jgi:DNA-binding transcriptional LysR family regulator
MNEDAMFDLLDHRLATLAVVARTGSYTAAAEELFISQPAVSQQIASLSSELGVRLIERRGRRMELTQAALDLVGYANRVGIDGQHLVERLQLGVERPIALGATLSISQFLLPRLVARAVADKVPFSVRISNTADLLEGIDAGTIDLALIEGNFDRTAYGFMDLHAEPFVAVLPADAPQPSGFEDLLQTPLLLRERGSGTRAIFEDMLAARGLGLTDFRRVIEVSDPAAIIEILKQGCGVSFMYRALVADLLARGELLEGRASCLHSEHLLSAVYLKGSSDVARYWAFLDLGRERKAAR